MNLFAAISDSYKRWRHAKGFGVHSPFAYRLVKTAIAPDGIYGYYGYHDIETDILTSDDKGYPRLAKDARLILRLLATLEIQRMLTCSEVPKAFETAAAAAGAHAVFASGSDLPASGNKDMILVDGDRSNPEEIKRRMKENGTSVMAINPSAEMRAALLSFHENGILFSGKRIVIAIPNPDVSFVEYAMKI